MGRRKPGLLSFVFHGGKATAGGHNVALYEWQAPGTSHAVLERRREELLRMNLIANSDLRDEWGALIRALDACVRKAAIERASLHERQQRMSPASGSDNDGEHGDAMEIVNPARREAATTTTASRQPTDRARLFLSEFLDDDPGAGAATMAPRRPMVAAASAPGAGAATMAPRRPMVAFAARVPTPVAPARPQPPLPDAFTAGMLPGTAPRVAVFRSSQFSLTDSDLHAHQQRIAQRSRTDGTLKPTLSASPARPKRRSGTPAAVPSASRATRGGHGSTSGQQRNGAKDAASQHYRRSGGRGITPGPSQRRLRGCKQPGDTSTRQRQHQLNHHRGGGTGGGRSERTDLTPERGSPARKAAIAARKRTHQTPVWRHPDVSILGRRIPQPEAGNK